MSIFSPVIYEIASSAHSQSCSTSTGLQCTRPKSWNQSNTHRRSCGASRRCALTQTARSPLIQCPYPGKYLQPVSGIAKETMERRLAGWLIPTRFMSFCNSSKCWVVLTLTQYRLLSILAVSDSRRRRTRTAILRRCCAPAVGAIKALLDSPGALFCSDPTRKTRRLFCCPLRASSKQAVKDSADATSAGAYRWSASDFCRPPHLPAILLCYDSLYLKSASGEEVRARE